MSGHINLDSNAGNLLYEYSKRDDVNIIFEIGTWNGLGTTNCIYEAIKGTNKKLITCETNLAMYQIAKSNLQDRSEITLYRGKVTDEMVDLDEFDDSFHQKYSLIFRKALPSLLRLITTRYLNTFINRT